MKTEVFWVMMPCILGLYWGWNQDASPKHQ